MFKLLIAAALLAAGATAPASCGGGLAPSEPECAALLALAAASLCVPPTATLCGWRGETPDSYGRKIRCAKGHVTEVVLYDCGIAALPASFGALQAEIVYLNLNALTALPQSIGKMSALWALRLDNNSLAALPGSMAQLTKLTAASNEGEPGLVLTNNKLERCPAAAIVAKTGPVGLAGNPCTASGKACARSGGGGGPVLAPPRPAPGPAAPAPAPTPAPKRKRKPASRGGHVLTYMFVCLGLALAVFVVGACCTKSDYGEQMAEYREYMDSQSPDGSGATYRRPGGTYMSADGGVKSLRTVTAPGRKQQHIISINTGEQLWE